MGFLMAFSYMCAIIPRSHLFSAPTAFPDGRWSPLWFPPPEQFSFCFHAHIFHYSHTLLGLFLFSLMITTHTHTHLYINTILNLGFTYEKHIVFIFLSLAYLP